MIKDILKKFADKGLIPKTTKRNFLPHEVLELQERHRAASVRRYEAEQIKSNTALVPRGKEVAAELEAVANLLDQAFKSYVAATLVKCGYEPGEKCTVNFTTGEVVAQK